MVNYPQKIFTIHFPGKKVYIENTCESICKKMEDIKNNKDHNLYLLLKEYPNILKYIKDNYKILNVNLLPPNFSLF